MPEVPKVKLMTKAECYKHVKEGHPEKLTDKQRKVLKVSLPEPATPAPTPEPEQEAPVE